MRISQHFHKESTEVCISLFVDNFLKMNLTLYILDRFPAYKVLDKCINRKETMKVLIVPEKGWFGQSKYSTHI